jgi:hypothetical protein
MALSIIQKPNTSAPTGDYPYGDIRDTQPGIPGTPVNRLVYADFHQFFAKLMDFAGVTPNGLPDNDYSGWQLMEALTSLMGGLKTKVLPIGVWDMDATIQVLVPHGLSGASQIREISAMIVDDTGATKVSLMSTAFTGSLGGGAAATSTDIALSRVTGGVFDTAGYNDGSINRGYVIIRYNEDL